MKHLHSSYGDVKSMPVAERIYFLNRLAKDAEEQSKAIEESGKR